MRGKVKKQSTIKTKFIVMLCLRDLLLNNIFMSLALWPSIAPGLVPGTVLHVSLPLAFVLACAGLPDALTMPHATPLPMEAWGGSNIGQITRARLTKILPARQTHVWRFFGQPFGGNTCSENAPQKRKKLLAKGLAAPPPT